MLLEENAEQVWGGWMPKGPATTSSVVLGSAEDVHASSDCCEVLGGFVVVLHAWEVSVSDRSHRSGRIMESGSFKIKQRKRKEKTQSLVGYDDKYAN
jgi:hypothetical protein